MGSDLHSHLPAVGPMELSYNENPYLPLPAVLEAINRSAAEINRYPDILASELVAALAAKYHVAEDQISTGNGSIAVLQHILLAFVNPGEEVVYPWRSFEAFPMCVAVAHGVSVPVPILPDGRLDLIGLAAAITEKTKVVIVCSPNNPTGAVVTQKEFINFMNQVPETVLVILDEAYSEFIRDPEAVDGIALLSHYPNLVSLRTMSKAYGLAGLRIGFVVGSAELIAGIRVASTPFGVDTLAEAAAVAALNPAAERVASARVAAIVAERSRVIEGLQRQGWTVGEAQGNFVWLPLGRGSTAFAAAARDEGMLVKAFDDDGVNGGVRVTIAEGAANNQFLSFANRYRQNFLN